MHLLKDSEMMANGYTGKCLYWLIGIQNFVLNFVWPYVLTKHIGVFVFPKRRLYCSRVH